MGLKRICISCSGRFYDLNKRPIICPECNAEFTGEIKHKTRRGRVAATDAKKEEFVQEAPLQKDEGEILPEDSEVEVVSLDNAEVPIEEDDDIAVFDEDTLDDIPDLVASDSGVDDEDIILDDEE